MLRDQQHSVSIDHRHVKGPATLCFNRPINRPVTLRKMYMPRNYNAAKETKESINKVLNNKSYVSF